MSDRDFSEVDLRLMLGNASTYRRDIEPGRWVIETRHGRRGWEVIVEPDPDVELLLIITADPVWE